jgi:hypothetical protein
MAVVASTWVSCCAAHAKVALRRVTVVANGRNDWTGGVDLTREQITARAIENTARVIREVDADIMGVVEAEARITLKRFSDTLFITGSGDDEQPLYPHAMVIDDNDARD